MSNLNFVKIISALSMMISCFTFSAVANSAPSALDSALNTSLQEAKELSGSISETLESRKESEESRKVMEKNRKVVQLNLEEADGEKSATQSVESGENTQATSNLIESSY